MTKLMNLSLTLEVDYIKVCPDMCAFMKNHEDCSFVDGEMYYKKWKVIEDELVRDMQVIFKPDVKEIPVVVSDQVVYKLRHKATGYYFDPQGCTTNASLLGKVFTGRKPPRQNFIGLPYELSEGKSGGECYRDTELDEWEVVPFGLTNLTK